MEQDGELPPQEPDEATSRLLLYKLRVALGLTQNSERKSLLKENRWKKSGRDTGAKLGMNELQLLEHWRE